MEEYKPNSRKSKEEPAAEKKIEKVVSGSVKSKKKNEIQKFADVFISDDVSNVKSYILMDVLVPAIKKALSDIVTNGIDMVLYGETGRAKNRTPASRGSHINYSASYDRPSERSSYTSRAGFDYDDLIFETRGDAESVLDAMNDVIGQYGVVSVGDLYDLANVSTDNYTSNKYGWTDIRGCKAVRVRDGYVLKLPRALPLN